MANLSADSLTDTQKAKIEERPSETGGKPVTVQDGASKAVSQSNKRPAGALAGNGADQDHNEEVRLRHLPRPLHPQRCCQGPGARTMRRI